MEGEESGLQKSNYSELPETMGPISKAIHPKSTIMIQIKKSSSLGGTFMLQKKQNLMQYFMSNNRKRKRSHYQLVKVASLFMKHLFVTINQSFLTFSFETSNPTTVNMAVAVMSGLAANII